MLAYVFWHWPRPHIDAGAYEESLVRFHRSLAADPPPGFQRSLSVRVDALPWPDAPAGGYEDWYLLDGSAALDPLNNAAVSGAHKTPHNHAAHAAAGGAGGLYRFQDGALDPGDAPAAAWLGKPDGMGYAAFDVRLRAWTDGVRVGLWRRQMVLGPAPEFCLLVPDGFLPPADAAARVVRRRVVG
ncbi:MAG: hypothetical protein M3Y74_05225 [Chloroflexota bacterium]|nr:hypothetical protein [Chloroflexota bacterium]